MSRLHRRWGGLALTTAGNVSPRCQEKSGFNPIRSSIDYR